MFDRSVLFALLAFALPACTSWKLAPAASGALAVNAPAPPNAAKICVARTSAMAQAVTFPTHDNGVLVGATRGIGHFCYLAEPGEHEIAIEADEVENAKLQAEAGKTYYLHEEVDNILGYVKCRAVWRDAASAAELFQNSDHEVLTGVPGNEKLPENPPFAPAKKVNATPAK
jgi:hypothetical protein